MDHASALSQIKAQAPHWIFATGYTNDLILMRKQMADLKIEAPVVTMIAGPAYQEFIDARRQARGERHQRRLVASGGALQGQGHVRHAPRTT